VNYPEYLITNLLSSLFDGIIHGDLTIADIVIGVLCIQTILTKLGGAQ